MTNTLYLPELREMLADNNTAELREFCTALHPARTAEFMEGLTAEETWQVLLHADLTTRVEIFEYVAREKQIEIISTADRGQMAELLTALPTDECVDLLNHVDPGLVAELLPLIPTHQRRDILRLREFDEDTAGALMTTEFARIHETATARQALDAVVKQAESLETIYYVYVVDDEDHLRGIVSARQLLSAMGKGTVTVGDLMERDVVSVEVDDDRETVGHRFADFDLLALPVVDHEHRMLGIITHDDALDAIREAATEDAHRQGGMNPLELGYLEEALARLAWKRGIWLMIFFFGALITAFALRGHEDTLASVAWLVFFIPLVNSSGGNSGNQSATLVITALRTGDITITDWLRVVRRELVMGLMLGGILALIGFLVALVMTPSIQGAAVLGITLLIVVICGAVTGSMLPLLFHRLGLDPAMMSNPFVACLSDLLSVLIYMKIALWLLPEASLHSPTP